MKVVKAWEEKGARSQPLAGVRMVIFAPDKGGVEELSFSPAMLSPSGCPDCHSFDRPELISVVSGTRLMGRFVNEQSAGCCRSMGSPDIQRKLKHEEMNHRP